MSRQILQRIQNAIIHGEYDVTIHAAEELAEDDLDILDAESALMNGELTKTETDDQRGARYTIVGTATNSRTRVGVVGRFKETGVFLIITAFQVIE